jgi:hypothetical protein
MKMRWLISRPGRINPWDLNVSHSGFGRRGNDTPTVGYRTSIHQLSRPASVASTGTKFAEPSLCCIVLLEKLKVAQLVKIVR